MITKQVEDGEILVDSNSFSSYKIKDGKITKLLPVARFSLSLPFLVSPAPLLTGSFRVTSINYVYVTNGSDTTVPHFATLDIFSYAGSTNKTSLGTQSRDNNGSGTVGQFVHLWRSTSAINSIALFPNSGNFKTGTIATLYGILKA